MSKYRQIKAVAHGFAHSFVSMMNFEGDDYIMDVMIETMHVHHLESMTLDVLQAKLEPKVAQTDHLTSSIHFYCHKFFPRLLKTHGVPSSYIQQAEMCLTILFSQQSVVEGMSDTVCMPYICTMRIVDNKDRVYRIEIRANESVSSRYLKTTA